ncbi:unnamed protein product [Chrysoparadoxa australica]
MSAAAVDVPMGDVPGAGAPEATTAESAQQGKVKGVIKPPPDIREVLHKTARFVAKNGKSFEERIMASADGQSAKFNFMKAHDPYYGYYEYAIRFFEEGGEDIDAVGKPAPAAVPDKPKEAAGAATTHVGVERKAMLEPIAKAAKSVPKDLAPPPYEFSMGHPSGLTAMQVDVIKLTAQYTAAGGKSFLRTLARKEAGNEQFQFLKHTHALFSYFTSLVDAYAKVLQPSQEQKEHVTSGSDKGKVLERVVHRWEYETAQEAKRRAAQEEADADRVAFRAVDWHDFVVVDTIDFAADELMEAQYDEDDMDVDMEMEEEEPAGEAEAAEEPPPPPVRYEDDESGITVVRDYRPTVAAASAAAAGDQMVVDPISGKSVRASELSDHMRIQLLDPQWRENQKKHAERQADTGMASGDSIAQSLKAFASRRGDIFGTAEEEEAQLVRESAERKKRMEETNRIIWDGRNAEVEGGQQPAPGVAFPPRRGAQPSPAQPPPPQPPAKAAAPVAPPEPPAAAAAPPPPPPQKEEPAPPKAAAMMPPPPAAAAAAAATPPPPGPPSIPFSQPPLPPAAAAFSQPPAGQGMAPPLPQEDLAPPVPSQPPPPSVLPEDEWARENEGAMQITVQCPTDDSTPSWGLKGQTVSISLPSVMATVKSLKQALQGQLGGMPLNKQQVRSSCLRIVTPPHQTHTCMKFFSPCGSAFDPLPSIHCLAPLDAL